MSDEYYKRRRIEDELTGGGRGRGRSFGPRDENRRDRDSRPSSRSYREEVTRGRGDYGQHGHRWDDRTGFSPNDRGGHRQSFETNRGGRGGFQGAFRGNFRGGRGGGSHQSVGFHKMAGGDFQRMPDSVENEQLVKQENAYGTEGTPIELVSNFYRILHSDIKVHHYDTTITKVRLPQSSQVPQTSQDGDVGKKDSKQKEELSDDKKLSQERFIKRFADLIVDNFAKAYPDTFQGAAHAYDGWKSLYTTKGLDFGSTAGEELSKEVSVDIDGKMARFRVSLRLVDRVSLSEAVSFYNGTSSSSKRISERVISIFEVILRFVISKSNASYQRKFFDLTQIERSPKVKLVDFVQGFINSVRMTEFGLALNVHLKTSAIISKSYDTLLALICDLLRVSDRDLERGLQKQQLFTANKIIRHLKMCTKHSKRTITYTIDGLVQKTPREVMFECQGKCQSIEQYFKNEYNLRLRPLPMVRPSGNKQVLLPLELCFLQESQFLNKSKFDPNIERELLFKSTHQPNAYFHKVAAIVSRIKELDSAGLLSQFGIDLQPKAARFQGRVLPPPRTLNANNRDRFLASAPSTPWGLFCFDQQCNEGQLKSFSHQMISKARQLGLRLEEPSFTQVVPIHREDDLKAVFSRVTTKTNAKLILVGIPARHDSLTGSAMHSTIKHCCEQMYGIMTQCFRTEVLHKMPPGYFETFLLKVNGKLGGQNSALDPQALRSLPFNCSETMLVGVDVSHPGESERVLSSVAAAVGSYDATFAKYSASLRVQRKECDEMVKQLDGMMSELLQQYAKHNRKAFPRNVIVFRDGVSEGQFDKVLAIEVPLIRGAFKALTGQNVKLVLVVVQKRHHTRFARTQQNTDGRKPTYNVPSGTVVDRGIVEPYLKVFYLNSHFSPLGTSKPTKYITLVNDLRLSSDELQKLCFYSCFNSIRTRSPIAIPTPVRYADLCAYRSKHHLEAQRAEDNGKSSYSATDEEDLIGKLNEQAQLHEDVKHRLFYC